MKIERSAAVALFVALGLKNADKWNTARMATKLSKVNEMVDEDVQLDETEAATLAAVRAAVEANEDFEIVQSVGAEPDDVAEPIAEQAVDVPAAEKPKKPEKPKVEHVTAAEVSTEILYP